MNEQEKIQILAGRIAALEVISMMALGLYLSNSRNDPDFEKAGALIDALRDAIKSKAQELSPAAQSEAIGYGDNLLNQVAGSLPGLRGHGGQLN